jgi:hypothetical protein
MSYIEIEEFLGKTFTEVSAIGDNTSLYFKTETEVYEMFHEPDCCEDVYLDEYHGDFKDLVGKPILKAEESIKTMDDYSKEELKDNDMLDEESFTWTFYNIATIKGDVQLKWYGVSNGYYSESISIKTISLELYHKMKKDKVYQVLKDEI